MAHEPKEPKPKRMTEAGLAREAQAMSALALDTLASIMNGEGQDSVRLAAAREVLDRGHGKAKSSVKSKPAKAPPRSGKAVRVIIKRFSDVTPEEEAAADATERGEW